MTRSKESKGAFELLIEGGVKESVLGRTLVESLGPIRSFLLWSANRGSGGRIFPKLNRYFGNEIDHGSGGECDGGEQLFTSLFNLDAILKGEDDVPEHFIGKENYAKWKQLKASIQTKIEPSDEITDYVLFDRDDKKSFAFVRRGDEFIPIAVNNGDIVMGTSFFAGAKHEAIETELAIEKFKQKDLARVNDYKVRRLSSITNDFACRRHLIFERDGAVVTNLRHQGVWSLGEFQEASRQLFSRGIYYDGAQGKVMIDDDLFNQVHQVCLTSEGNPNQSLRAKNELEFYVRENIFWQMINAYFNEHPLIVTNFMQSDAYQKLSYNFKDKYLSSIGLTEKDTAQMMLANYLLYRFEGYSDPAASPSQKYLASIPEFHVEIQKYCEQADTDHTLLQDSIRTADSQMQILGKLFQSIEKKDLVPFTQKRLTENHKTNLLKDLEDARKKMAGQINRHEFDERGVKWLENKGVLVSRKGIFATLISNFSLAKVDARRYTATSWLTQCDNYLPTEDTLPDIPAIEKKCQLADVVDAVRVIFPPSNFSYEEQDEAIIQHAPQILSFLAENGLVPDKVHQFMSQVVGHELPVRVLERYCDICGNDPLIVNRFLPDGVSEFQKSACYRYIFEFVRGIETNLILLTRPENEKLQRQFGGKWRAYDFSRVSESIINQAITLTLNDASHRIDLLNHEIGVKRTTVSDYQDLFEKVFGWDTIDIRFLRWEKFWDIWNTLGGAWDCICFSRKTVFNPHTWQQW